MKVILHLEWPDEERALLSEYLRRARGVKRVPALARREDVRLFMGDALAHHWTYAMDLLKRLDEPTPPAVFSSPVRSHP
jgi:hypothetical protein